MFGVVVAAGVVGVTAILLLLPAGVAVPLILLLAVGVGVVLAVLSSACSQYTGGRKQSAELAAYPPHRTRPRAASLVQVHAAPTCSLRAASRVLLAVCLPFCYRLGFHCCAHKL